MYLKKMLYNIVIFKKFNRYIFKYFEKYIKKI